MTRPYDLRADKRYDFACRNADTGCGGRTNFTHRLCLDCWEEQQRAAWELLPVVQWDGEGMVCSQTTNEFYDDLESAVDDLFNDDEGDIDDLQLVICVPLKPPHFDLGEWVEGYTHDDWEMGKEEGEIEDKINALLQSVTGLGYEPGKTRPDTTALQKELEAHRAKENMTSTEAANSEHAFVGGFGDHCGLCGGPKNDVQELHPRG